MLNFADNIIGQMEAIIRTPIKPNASDILRTGVDLGTMYTVITVCNSDNVPICCSMRQTDVVRDGLVVDYIGAAEIVRQLKKETEDKIGRALETAAIAIPPGIGTGNTKTHRYVVEGAGIEVTAVEDEPTAANRVLNIQNGAVVDIGGGTTGISIFKNGRVVYTADEATGGIHFTYVIAGNRKISFEAAEKMKVDLSYKKEIFTMVTPVIDKIASIIIAHIKGSKLSQIVLCGGTSCLEGIESVIQNRTGIRTIKPINPFLVTPLGIALSCPLALEEK